MSRHRSALGHSGAARWAEAIYAGRAMASACSLDRSMSWVDLA